MFPGVTNNHYSYLLCCGVGITQYVFNRLNDVIRWFPNYTCLTAPLQAISNQSRKGGINARVLETSEVLEQGKMGRIADGWGRDDLTLWKPNSTVKFLFYTTPRAQHRRFLRNQPLYLCLTDLDGTHVIGLVAYYQAPYWEISGEDTRVEQEVGPLAPALSWFARNGELLRRLDPQRFLYLC